MKIYVREAQAADAPAIADIFVESWKSTYANIIPASLLHKLSPDALVPEWAERIDADSEEVFIAEHSGKTVGFAHLAGNKDEDLRDQKLDVIELHHLYFHPEAVNRGLGSEMWGILEESLIGKLVVLWFLDENQAAHHFYIKQGFEQDLVSGLYHFQGRDFPKVRYRKQIH